MFYQVLNITQKISAIFFFKHFLTILFLFSLSVQRCKTLEDIHSRSHTGYLQIIFEATSLL